MFIKNKFFVLTLVSFLLLSACNSNADKNATNEVPTPENSETQEVVLDGKGDGFGGVLNLKVTKKGDKISKVEIGENSETLEIAKPALDTLPNIIVEKNSPDVDTVASATYTSKAIIYAVNNALDPAKFPYPIPKEPVAETKPEELTADSIFQGLGYDNGPRKGPGKDKEDVQVYSFNQVFANALFDKDGKILALFVDQLEVASPNYDGEGMPHFSGYPGQLGYNTDEKHDGTITKPEPTEESFLAEIKDWKTKRERGDSYKLSSGTWTSEMDKFQELFIGKTVVEVEEWYEKYCSDLNGRPLNLKGENDKPEDIEKYEKLTQEEKDMLVDVVSGATMSLNDAHGNILAAIKNAYENKHLIDVKSVSGLGLGVTTNGRIQNEDAEGAKQYSINVVLAANVFDADGKIASLFLDQYEITTPNSSSVSAPHLSGLPGQGGYNYDEKHDKAIAGKTPDTEEFFMNEMSTWITKRSREDYKMTSGTWAEQANKYQEIFAGKSVKEVDEWYKKYCSDVNGRPIKETSELPEDIEKLGKLSDDDKKMLVDVTSSASMSLNDNHGDLVKAIEKSDTFKLKTDIKTK